jgi:hypothetical protein
MLSISLFLSLPLPPSSLYYYPDFAYPFLLTSLGLVLASSLLKSLLFDPLHISFIIATLSSKYQLEFIAAAKNVTSKFKKKLWF